MKRLHEKLSELEELHNEVRALRLEKERIKEQMERTNRLLKQQQLDIRNFDAFRTTPKRSDAKTDLLGMQQRHEATSRELQQLDEDLRQRGVRLAELENSARSRIDEIRQFESMGIAKQEIDALVAQRNELFEQVTQLEKREEVQRQLEQTHQDRVAEQRAFHEQCTQIGAQLEQVVRENEKLKDEIGRLRDEAVSLKRDRDAFLEHAAAQFTQRLQREIADVQKQSTNEITNLKSEVFEANEKSKQMQRELDRKNSALQSLQ